EVVLRCSVVRELLQATKSPMMLLTRASTAASFKHLNIRVRRLDGGSFASSVLKAGLRRFHGWSSKTVNPPDSLQSRPVRPVNADIVLVAIEDTGTKVNLLPAIAVLSEMRDRQLTPVIISTRSDVLQVVRSQGFTAHNLAEPS